MDEPWSTTAIRTMVAATPAKSTLTFCAAAASCPDAGLERMTRAESRNRIAYDETRMVVQSLSCPFDLVSVEMFLTYINSYRYLIKSILAPREPNTAS